VNWVQIGVNGGAVGLLAVFVTAILRGLLVPRSQVEVLIAIHKERAEDYKEAYIRVDARNDEQARQLGILIPLAETSARALEAIRSRTQDRETAT